MSAKELRNDENYVADAVAKHVGAEWAIGEDPPDVCLHLQGRKIALEISSLNQRIINEKGDHMPRMSEDATAFSLEKELKRQLHEIIPDDRRISLILSSPILEIRKTSESLGKLIVKHLENSPVDNIEKTYNIYNNIIKVIFCPRDNKRKITSIISNRHAGFNLTHEASLILQERILDKIEKCRRIDSEKYSEIWLGLLNEYYIADIGVYRDAFRNISISHQFSKILIVSLFDSVDILFPNQ